jgi:radical SAM superfamily enzyme YgiQ (UPF0313 family)
MKLLLVQPPTENLIVGNNPAIIDEERGCNPPLGILYVAGFVEANTSHDVEVLDCLVEKLSFQDIAEHVRQSKPDVVGITCLTFTLVDAVKVAGVVKAVNPDIIVVLGGPHPSIYPEETAALPGVDFVVVGEGEQTMADLLDALGRGDRQPRCPGIAYLQDGQIVNTGRREPIKDLDALPMPARHLTPYRRYTSLLAKGTAVTTMFTSRGCPFGCKYCDRPNMGRMFRFRSAENVVSEFEQCLNMGIDEFLVYDDTFSVSKKRALEICKTISHKGLMVYWDMRTRVDLVDRELLEALREAGCIRIHYGVEAGTDAILKNLNRGVTVEQVRETFRLTKEVGIGTLGYFMVGNPGETREDIERTMALADELSPDFAHITILTPFPATELYRDALARGMYETDHWAEFARNPTPDFRPRFWEENLTADELRSVCERFYRRFYGRPGFMLKRLLQIRSFGEFVRNVRAGYRLFTTRIGRSQKWEVKSKKWKVESEK